MLGKIIRERRNRGKVKKGRGNFEKYTSNFTFLLAQ
jgi:hypothetical protein